MKGRTYSMVGEKANNPFTSVVTPNFIVSQRIQVLSGGYVQNGSVCVFSMKYKALSTATNSPSILNNLPKAIVDSALSVIDITSGISSTIDGIVPCGISTSGTLWVQSITTDHIYSVAGSYIVE